MTPPPREISTPDGQSGNDWINPPSELINPEIVEEQAAESQEASRERIQLEQWRAAQKQSAYDNDWMLRDYTERLQAKGLAPADKPNPNPELGPIGETDPTTSLASQLDPLLPPTDSATPPALPSPSDKSENPADPTSTDETKSAGNSYLKPLLPPLTDSTKTITRLDAWGSDIVPAPGLTDLIPSPGLMSPTGNATSSENGDSVESLDVPGLTARQQNGANDGLNLPDEQAEVEAENSGNQNRHDFLVPTVASNSSEFFRKQAEAMSAPNSQTYLHPEIVSMPLPKMPPPAPVPKMPPPTGIRQLADPFDLIGGRR